MPKVEVPLYLQPHIDFCVPTCIKMVLDSLRLAHGEKIPRLSIRTIRKTVRTQEGRGTTFDDIDRINQRLLPSIPSVKFCPEFPCEWSTVGKENREGRPIIAWLWIPDDRDPQRIRGCGHSVVITDLDESLGEVFYNDPLKGECKEDTGSFISKWEHEAVNRTLIRVEVGERKQREISEFAVGYEDEEENEPE